MKTPGQVAFEKWNERFSSPYKRQLDRWERLPSVSKERWEEIARAAIKQHFTNREY